MFVSEMIPALFKKGVLKLQETDDGYRRVAEATLMIEPFPLSLARELGDEIANHLYDDNDAIRGELESIDLRPRVGLQRVSVRHDEALEPLVELDEVSVKDLCATVIEDKKTNRRWLSFSFVLTFSLHNRESRNFVIDEFGKALVWSFRPIQRDLLQNAKDARADILEAAAKLGDHGETAIIGPDGERTEFNPETSKRLRQEAKDLRSKAH